MVWDERSDFHEDEELTALRPASFILRCWIGRGHETRARLVDVHSGVSYPLANLRDLPNLIEHLLGDSFVPPPPGNAERE